MASVEGAEPHSPCKRDRIHRPAGAAAEGLTGEPAANSLGQVQALFRRSGDANRIESLVSVLL